MSRPVGEPSLPGRVTGHGYDIRQLQRRPVMTPASGDCGQYTFWSSVMNTTEPSTTTTVLEPCGQSSQEVPDVFPINSGNMGWADDTFWAYDFDNSAVTILQPGVYDVTMMCLFDDDDPDVGTSYTCNFNRSIELRIGEKVVISDYTDPIPASEHPLAYAWWSCISDLWPSGSWSAPDAKDALYFTGNLKQSYRVKFDEDFFGAYDGATVQGFYSHDGPADQISLWTYLQIIRLCGGVQGPTPAE